MQPKGLIQIVLTPEGQVQVSVNAPDRATFLMMMEVAKIDMERKMHEQEQQKVQAAPALNIPNLRG